MTDAERAALVERVAREIEAVDADQDPWGPTRAAEDILAAIEPAIRADERARVVEEATTDEAIQAAEDAYCEAPQGTDFDDWIRAAIRAALGVEP